MLGIFLCLDVTEKYDEKDKKNTKKPCHFILPRLSQKSLRKF